MGVNTHLTINSKYTVDDIRLIIEKHFEVIGSPIIKTTQFETMFTISWNFSDPSMWKFVNREMIIHTNYNTPLGNCALLSLGSNKESVKIMGVIAKVIGGYLEEEDCSGTGEMIKGMFDDEDGLAYFLKKAAMEGYLNENDDLEGLQDFIKEWNKKYGGK